MARLLVSVRSANEAVAAFQGGAAIIDIKEPDHGSLGRAPWSVWRAVRKVVPTAIPLSVALGELPEWLSHDRCTVPANAWTGISYRKLGLAGSGPDWRQDWRCVRALLGDEAGPPWIAVIYADWQMASAPDPQAVLLEALDDAHMAGVLLDTSDKTRPIRIDDRWVKLIEQVRRAGKLMALAGGLDVESISRLGPLAPDIIAVRGAACRDGNRRAEVDPRRVAALARMVSAGNCDQPPTSNATPCASGRSAP